MTGDKYNTIVELAKQGLSGIEIVNAINAVDKGNDGNESNDAGIDDKKNKDGDNSKDENTLSKNDNFNDDDKTSQIINMMKTLELRINTLSETFNAINILNSEQPENKVTSADILGEVFGGVTTIKESEKR